MLGALVAYITDPYQENLQPMGANMGLLPALTERYRDKQKKYQAYAERALAALEMALAASDMTVEAETLARKSAAF